MHLASFIYAVSLLFITLVFCEYIIYYVTLYKCSWPELEVGVDDELLKVALIADTHLLGIRKGHWFDKLRREWQMYMSFQTLMALHQPEIIFILGDIFDEASFSPDNLYKQYLKTFHELFRVNNGTEMFVVAGNHDIGFHYRMHPYLEHRFSKSLDAPSVRLITRKNNHFVLINSMALERDGCNICRKAESDINYISAIFCCSNGSGKCYHGMKLEKYNRPILLQHFPLYRINDADCTESNSASGQDKFNKFKQKWDCLSEDATKFILDKLHPRVVFTGHTHHACHIHYENDIDEYTIPSFNWRNKPNPSFILNENANFGRIMKIYRLLSRHVSCVDTVGPLSLSEETFSYFRLCLLEMNTPSILASYLTNTL